MLNQTIHLSELSKQGTLAGSFPLAAMVRLTERLQTPLIGDLSYQLECQRDAGGRLIMHASLSAMLAALCQRCLETFKFPLQVARRFYLCEAADAKTSCPNDCEEVDLSGGSDVSVADFLEDELILSVPMSPLHALSDCLAAQYIGQ